MNLFIGITDQTWFNNLRNRADLDEVNFWQPGILSMGAEVIRCMGDKKIIR